MPDECAVALLRPSSLENKVRTASAYSRPRAVDQSAKTLSLSKSCFLTSFMRPPRSNRSDEKTFLLLFLHMSFLHFLIDIMIRVLERRAPRSGAPERRSERPERRSERNSDFPAGARPGAQLRKFSRSATGAQLRFLPER